MNTNKMVVSGHLNMALIFTRLGNICTWSAKGQHREKKYRAYPEWAIRPSYLG